MSQIKKNMQWGLSLVEVMIAVVILSTIIASTVAIVNKNQDVHAGLHEEFALYHEVRAAVTLLENDISMIFIMKPRFDYDGGREIYDAVFVGEPQKLSAVTMNYRKRLAKSRDTNISEVEYYLLPGENADTNEPAFTLMKKVTSFLDADLFGEGVEYTVLTDIKSWVFKFYNNETGQWESKWDSRSEVQKNKMPTAVAIEFEVYERDPDDPFAEANVLYFETKFLADASIERSKIYEISKSVQELKELVDQSKGTPSDNEPDSKSSTDPSKPPPSRPQSSLIFKYDWRVNA